MNLDYEKITLEYDTNYNSMQSKHKNVSWFLVCTSKVKIHAIVYFAFTVKVN